MPNTIAKIANGMVRITQGLSVVDIQPDANVNFDTQTKTGLIIETRNQSYLIHYDEVTSPASSSRQDLLDQLTNGQDFFSPSGTGGTQDVNIVNDPINSELYTQDEKISAQNPLPADGDSMYVKDINVDSAITDNGDFSGTVADYFNALESVNVNSTASAVKSITIWFHRTQYADSIGLGCADMTKKFSQNISLKLLGSGGVVRKIITSTIGDRNSRVIRFYPEALNGFTLDFEDAGEVALSNITMRKGVAVESTIKGQKSDGTTSFIGISDSGNLKTTDAENGLAIAMGEVASTGFIHKFGNAPNFDSGVEVTITDLAEDGEDWELMSYIYSVGDDIDSISSVSASDSVTVEVQGQTLDGVQVVQNATLNGQTRVALTTPLNRVYRIKNIDSTDLVGHVVVYENTTISGGIPVDKTKLRAVVHPENNQTEMAIYRIPSGKRGYMRSFYSATAGANKDTSYIIRLKARKDGGVFQLKHKTALADKGNTYFQHKYIEPEVFAEMTDIEMTVEIAEGGKTDASISAGFDIVLKDM